VEQALPHPGQSGPDRHHPWRTIAVVIAGVATLELLILVIVGIALVAKPMAHDAIAKAAAGPTPAVTKPKPEPMLPLLARRLVSVTVLNGNGVAGAAATEASRVRARGYIMGRVGNAPRGGYGHSVVMYRVGRVREARRLARDLGISIVTPLDGLRKADLHGAKLAVVLGG
jgi:LytR cell envelope-related transcriptional attenuator